MVTQISWDLGHQFWVLCACTIGVVCVTFGWFFCVSAKKERTSQPSRDGSDVCKQGKNHEAATHMEVNSKYWAGSFEMDESFEMDLDIGYKQKIFVSHSGRQKDFVEELCVALETRGHYPFFGYRRSTFPIAENFCGIILKATQECETVVVVISEEYFMSKWPMFELNNFVQSIWQKSNTRLKIIPIYYGLSVSEFRNRKRRERWFKHWVKMAEYDIRIDLKEWKDALGMLGTFNGISYNWELQGIMAYRQEIVSHICSSVERFYDKNLKAPTQLRKDVTLILSIKKKMRDMWKEVKFYRRQCKYLIQRSSEVSQEIHTLLGSNDMKLEDCLSPLISSLGGLVHCMEAGMALLQVCGDTSNEPEVALTLSSLAFHGDSFSQFALVLRDLDWYLDVFRFLLDNPEAGHATASDRQFWLSKFSWCENRCRLVLAGDGENRVADADCVESFLQADNERHTHDRGELISYLDISGIFSNMSFLRNRLQGESSFGDFVRVPSCFLIAEKLEYKVLEHIGGGSYKSVLKCKWLGMIVAIATFHYKGEACRNKLEAEAGPLARVQHRNVVNFLGCTYDAEKQNGFLVTELMETDLRALINGRLLIARSKSPFTLPVSVDIMLQIAEAMVHVHECRVIHRDLKALNCLVNVNSKLQGDGFVVKLIDFGEAKLQSTEMGSYFKTRNKGSTAWTAPEVYGKKGQYTWSADVYSFGMTCYEILTGKVPFDGESLVPRELKKKVTAGHRPIIPPDCPEGLAELMKHCWAQSPEHRPTFKEIRKFLWNCKLCYMIWGTVPSCSPHYLAPPLEKNWWSKYFKCSLSVDT